MSCCDVVLGIGAAGVMAGSGTLAAVALSNPIGAVGGAIFGATYFAITWGASELSGLLGKEIGLDDFFNKMIAVTASFFATNGILYGIAQAIGLAITFSATLGFVSLSLGLVAAVAALVLIVVGISKTCNKEAVEDN